MNTIKRSKRINLLIMDSQGRSEGLKNTKFCAMLLVLVILVGVFSLPVAISSLMNRTVIESTGEISTSNVAAKSGSARDIQLAVDAVVASSGIGSVFIPEGTFNFVEVGEPWTAVTLPGGVSLFGAPTERDANDQVIEWKTVLVMPYDVPGTWSNLPYWFKFNGYYSDPSFLTRFSDIKLVGYRSIDPNSITVHRGVNFQETGEFRVDHCYFEHVCGGVFLKGQGGTPQIFPTHGVIDHCYFVNKHGVVVANLGDSTIGYGVAVNRAYGDIWEDDVSKVLGQYTDYTVVIEDCYFEKWRHCVAANTGAHFVLRYSTIKDDFGFGSIDAHGWGVWDGTKVTAVGTRAIEVYNCKLLDPISPPPQLDAVWIRGGACAIFNNIAAGYVGFVSLTREAAIEVSKCWPHDCYVWNNELPVGVSPVRTSTVEEGVDYFLHAPHTFDYEPYPYPHPLTFEATP